MSRGRRTRRLPGMLALAVVATLPAACASPGELMDAAMGLSPQVDQVSPAAVPAPLATGGSAQQRAMRVPVRGPRTPLPPQRPARPDAPEPPGDEPWDRFEAPRPSVWPSPGIRPACPQVNDGTTNRPSRIEAGAGSVTVTFWNPGALDAVALTLIARSTTLRPGTQTEPASTTLPAPSECREVTATITGLARGEVYQVEVEQRSRSPIDGREFTKVVARTDAVTVR